MHPKVVTLCNCNLVNDQIIVNLAAGQDYILKDHVLLTHPVVIQGGHNVVWIGGHIRPSSGPDIAIQLKRNIGLGGGPPIVAILGRSCRHRSTRVSRLIATTRPPVGGAALVI